MATPPEVTSEPAPEATPEAASEAAPVYVPQPSWETHGPLPDQTLAVLRVLWGVLLVGQFILIAVATWIMSRGHGEPLDIDLTWKFAGFNAGMLVFNIILGTFIRTQCYKRCWRGGVISPMGYFTGNLVMFALLEMVIFSGVLISILNQSFWPSLAPSVLAMAVYGVNYPHGGPMFGNADPASINIMQSTPEPVSHDTEEPVASKDA